MKTKKSNKQKDLEKMLIREEQNKRIQSASTSEIKDALINLNS